MQKILLILSAIAYTPFSLHTDDTPTRNNRPIIYANELSETAVKRGVISKGNDDENTNNQDCQSHLEHEPSAIVNKCVNVITGLYMDFEMDYVIQGAEPFSFQRSYISASGNFESPLSGGWSRNYFGKIYKYKDEDKKRKYRAYVYDSLGSVYHYCLHSDSYKLFHECYKTHVTNSSSGVISAHTNILNNILKFEKDTAIFKKCNGEKFFFKDDEYGDFLLEKQIKTNGNELYYKYKNDLHGELRKVEAFGKTGQLLGIIEYEYSYKNTKKNRKTEISLKHGGKQKALYMMDNLGSGYHEHIVAAYREHAPNLSYEYEENYLEYEDPKMIQKNLPDNRFQKIGYYQKGSNLIGNTQFFIKKDLSSWVGRVKDLQAPVGNDETPITTHKFIYKDLDEKSGSAEVYDAYDHLTRYTWDENKRLVSLARYSGTSKKHKPSKYHISSVDRLYWGGDATRDEILLSARTFANGSGEIQYMRAFEYDEKGNILYDRLYGNLTGNNQKPCRIYPNGEVSDTGCECYVKHFTYSNKDLNLLETSSEDGVTQIFSYKKGTDLLISKLYKFKDKIFKREFYDYDENATLILEIEDDGSSLKQENLDEVTERRIRKITPQTISPIGLPWIVEEKYLDLETGKEVLLKKTIQKYNSEGLLHTKEIYDSKDKRLGVVVTDYDDHGNLIREVDILGQETIREYDANDNKIYEKISNSSVHKDFFYDYSNRLYKVDEVHENGLTLTESYGYDYLGHKVSSTDIYGNETLFKYDDFGRLAKTILPAANLDKKETGPIENYIEYNILNLPKSSTDFNGHTTFIEYNIRGKPTRKVYPDGTQENFIYNLNGTLKCHTHANGSYTFYEYDHLKRQLSEVTKDKKGKILESKAFTYNTFHLRSEIDAGGYERVFRYDDSGRLAEVTKGESRTTYSYDDCGRLYKSTEHDGKGKSVSHIQMFDLLDRVIEERQEDYLENILTKVTYGYDDYGNRDRVITYSGDVESTTKTNYDSRHQPTQIIDPLGNVTHIVYRYDYRNKFGQTVPYSTSTDPMGNITINIKDPVGNLVWIIQKNSFGKSLHKKCMYYDKNGNKCKQIDYPTTLQGSSNEPLETKWTYDCMNRLTSIAEAFGCSEQKLTEFRYNNYGQQSKIIKADSVCVETDYDGLGRSIRLFSSDGTVDDHYIYDANSNIKVVEDKVHLIQTSRVIDSMNRLAKETLGNGLAVTYTYDALNNPHILTFPDKTGVEYTYNCKRLQAVHRLSKDNKRKYTHRYTTYNLQDKITDAVLIGKAGKAHYIYDVKGQSTGLNYNCWNEKIDSYDKAGNILSLSIKDPSERTNCQYDYDDFYQVIKESGFTKHSYNFDSLNNRTKKNGISLEINKLNQLLNNPDTQYRYDLNGNLASKTIAGEIQTFDYDALDRLILVTSKYKRTSYRYDAQNRRLTKRVDRKNRQKNDWDLGKVYRFLYVGQNEVGRYDDKGKAIELRLLGLSKGAEIGAAVAVELGDKVYAPVHDHNGNVTALVDANTGKGFEFYRYTAFGEETLLDESGNEILFSRNPWRFSSKRVDNETGFIYFGRRYYEPGNGRWITPDPIGHSDGMNVYAFVHNRTLTMFDLYGLNGVDTNATWQSTFDSWGTTFVSYFNTTRQVVGRAIHDTAFHVVPVPLVKDCLQLAGLTIAGDQYDDFHFTFFGENFKGDLGRPEPDHVDGWWRRILDIGGICCSARDMEIRALATSEALGRCNVHYMAFASDGVVLDLGKAFLRNWGIPLPGDERMYRGIEKIAIDAGGSEKGVMHTKAHSQSGIVLSNYSDYTSLAMCKCMDIDTFGSGKYLDNDRFGKVTNYISVNDIVPAMSDPVRHVRAIFYPRQDVIFLPSNTLPLGDHPFDGDTYQNANSFVNLKIRKSLKGI